MMTDRFESLARQMSSREPRDILAWAIAEFPSIAISFSGAEDVALVHMACEIQPGIKVFTVDQGDLPGETYGFIETVYKTYPIDLELLAPDSRDVTTLGVTPELFSFYPNETGGHRDVMTIEPLTKLLSGLDAWVSGQRYDQNPHARAELTVVHEDRDFSSDGHQLTKVNPMARWSTEDVWTFIRDNGIPYNPLQEGFIELGSESRA